VTVPGGARNTTALTATALVAFAANSVLCRLALGARRIDPSTFTTLRLLAGAVVLGGIVALGRYAGANPAARAHGWRRIAPALMLFVYALGFSLAYVRLSVGTGALLLFGTVQLTMIASALWRGDRPGALEWAGLALALAGLVALVLPGLTAPPLHAAALMTVAGVGWGLYSLAGRGASDPLRSTASNFALALVPALAVNAIARGTVHVTPMGAVLAVTSGALASGLGYVAWYAALRGLSATRAAIVQLAVPVIAAAAGVLFMGEAVTVRLVLCAALILGGVGLASVTRRERSA
jgi:drug/metabolite transporter (DMT)-like permease